MKVTELFPASTTNKSTFSFGVNEPGEIPLFTIISARPGAGIITHFMIHRLRLLLCLLFSFRGLTEPRLSITENHRLVYFFKGPWGVGVSTSDRSEM